MSILKTQRLTLSPFKQNELDILHQLFTDPYIREYLWDDQILPKSQSEDILKVNLQLFQTNKWGLWKIQHTKSGEIMGFAGLWYFFEEPQPQLLYAILEKYSRI
ncbi:MAG: GNAT family N-acetyltransferase [Bacteroidota bacterium]